MSGIPRNQSLMLSKLQSFLTLEEAAHEAHKACIAGGMRCGEINWRALLRTGEAIGFIGFSDSHRREQDVDVGGGPGAGQPDGSDERRVEVGQERRTGGGGETG